MLSMEIYQMLHLIMVVTTLTCYAITLHGNSDKVYKIVAGIGSFLILVTGMGFLARLGYSHGDGFPFYIITKMIIWLVIAVGAPVVGKRFPQHGKTFFWFMLGLFAVVSYLISFKPI